MPASPPSPRPASRRMSRQQAIGWLVLGNIFWAGAYTAGKVALGELTPFELNAVRFTLAAIILAPVLVRQWPTVRGILRDRSQLLSLAELVLLGWVLNKALEYVGLSLSTAVDVALLIAMESLFTAVLSWLLLREPVTRVGVAALALGTAGAYLIVARGIVPDLAGPAGSQRVIGDVLVIFSLIFEAGYSIRGKRVLDKWPPLFIVSLTLTASLIVWIPAGLLSVWQGGWPTLSAQGWAGIVYMAVFATVIGYWLWFRGLSRLGGAEAAPLLFLQPLFGTLIAVLLLHDTLTWATLLGGALILGSLLMVMRGERVTAGSVPEAIGESVP